jgi:hypothetical protein
MFLSLMHNLKMVNEYKYFNLITCSFSTLFPFGIDEPKMKNHPFKLTL